MRSFRPFAVALVALVVLAPAAAHAAMTYVPDTGVVARSRGGAFTAAANDPMAVVYNPAGFADQNKMQIYLDVTALQLNSQFKRESEGTTSFKSVKNTGATKISPNLLYSMPIWEGFVWHIGAHGAVGVNSTYPKSGPQRYTTVDSVPQQLTYSTGVSYRINPLVSVGFTAGAMYITNQTSVVATLNAAAPPTEDPNNDVFAELDVANPMVPIGILGVKVTPIPAIEIGLSYRPPVVADLEGTYEAHYVVGGAEAAPPEDVTLSVPLPQIIRTGVRYVQPRWDAEVDFVLEDWSGRDQDIIDPEDGAIGAFTKIEIDRDGKPAFSVRLGGTFKQSETLQFHGGLYHETQGIPAERQSVNMFDAPKTGVAFGSSFSFAERFTVSGNLTYLMLASTDIGDSKVRQRSSTTPDPAATKVVGNGKYTGAYVMGGVAFTTTF